MTKCKMSSKIGSVVVVIIVLAVVGLLVKNSIAEKIIASKIDEAKGMLPNQIGLSYDGVRCEGFGLSTCTISGIKVEENGHFLEIGAVSFTENASLISFGMKNISNSMDQAEGSMRMAMSIKNIEFTDGTTSLLPPINIEKDVEVTLKEGKPLYVKINNHHITSSFIDANIKGEIKGIKFKDMMPLDATISHLHITATNKDLASLLSIVPENLLDARTRAYVMGLLGGKEEFFLATAMSFEQPKAKELMMVGNKFTGQKPVSLSITNKSGISMASLGEQASQVVNSESELFGLLSKNFELKMQ